MRGCAGGRLRVLRWFGGKKKRLREAPAAPEGGCGVGGAVDVLAKDRRQQT